MRFLLIALYLTISSIALGDDIAFTRWAGKHYECFIFRDTIADIDINKTDYTMRFSQKGDRLDFYSPDEFIVTLESDSSTHAKPNQGMCFIIECHDRDSIVLRPYKNIHYEQMAHIPSDDYLLDSNRTFTLYKPPLLADTTIIFKSLSFDLQNTYINADYDNFYMRNHGRDFKIPRGKPIINNTQLIIDSMKNIYLYCYKSDKKLDFLVPYYRGKQGYYQGHLSDSLYSELIKRMKMSCIDFIRPKQYPGVNAGNYHGSFSFLDIRYNDKHKRIDLTRLPLLAVSLYDYLVNIDNDVLFTPSKKAKDIFDKFNKANNDSIK
jgi:hypothetical protein